MHFIVHANDWCEGNTMTLMVQDDCVILTRMSVDKLPARFLPSSFDLSGDFSLLEMPKGTPWKRLTEHLATTQPHAVFGMYPEKLQLDVRVYEIVRELRIPYLSTNPRNTALACELIRQIRVDLIIGTRAEALELEKALREKHISIRSWYIILAPEEKGLLLPAGQDVVSEIHSSPGIPYES